MQLEAGTSLGCSLLATDCSPTVTSPRGSHKCIKLCCSICFPLPPTGGFSQLEPNGKPPLIIRPTVNPQIQDGRHLEMGVSNTWPHFPKHMDIYQPQMFMIYAKNRKCSK